MKFLFFIFVFIISISLAQATGFSPSSLVFDLEQGQEECKIITITSDSETIGVSDSWAADVDVEWKVSNFQTSAGVHGISIDYDDELSVDEREVEVCISGANIGEYHGVILLREEQEGNSIIQMGIWIKLTITEPNQEQTTTENNNGGSGGGGSGTPAKTPSTNGTETEESEEKAVEEETTTEEESESEEYNSAITGAVIGDGTRTRTIIFIVLGALVVAGFLIYNKQRKEKV